MATDSARAPIYLDANATMPLRPEAQAAMLSAFQTTGNASSIHRSGRRARAVIEEARAAIAELAGVAPPQVVFTGGATEADYLALKAFGGEAILAAAIEHQAILDNAPNAALIPADASGVITPTALEQALAARPQTALVTVMLVNNETGVIQPVAELAAVARQAGALFHCDAVQAAGRIPLDFDRLGVDSMALSAHKIGGPQGVGALILRDGLPFEAPIRGGGQEKRRRAGTENVAGIAGFGAAARAAVDDLERIAQGERLRDGLETTLRQALPDLTIFCENAPRVWNTSLLAHPGPEAATQLIKLDLAGFAVSSGAACSSGKVERSHVLAAMGVPDDKARTALRISLGWHNTAEEIERFAQAYRRLYEA